MSVYLIATSFITTVLIPAEEFQPGGAANGRALAYLAHEHLGNAFGTVYDISTRDHPPARGRPDPAAGHARGGLTGVSAGAAAAKPTGMSEFERERVMPADADRVFAIAGNAELFDRWLPGDIHVESSGPNAAHVDVAGGGEADATVGVERDQRRLEWGVRGRPDYTGWLQVMAAEDGRSSVVLHLSFHGDRPQNHGGDAAEEVTGQLDGALDRLAELVSQR